MRFMRARFARGILLLGSLLPVPTAQATIGAEFPFQLREGFIWVNVRGVGSVEPLHFLLDSGVVDLSALSEKTLGLHGLEQAPQVLP